MKRFLIPFVTFCLIVGVAAGVIAYGRGYRFDFKNSNVRPTGLISITSQPAGAQVFIDGALRAATDTSLNIDPGWYTVTIVKEGYQPWEKRVRVQGEVVTRADAFLVPSNPSLTAITSNGVASPLLSPDGTKLAFIVPPMDGAATAGAALTDRAGIWVINLADQPLGLNRDARQIATHDELPITSASMVWSADSKQLLVRVRSLLYLLETDRLNSPPQAASNVSLILREWQERMETKEKDRLMTLAPEFVEVATASMHIIAFSPDETKILYEATRSATIPDAISPPLIGANPTEEVRTLTKGNVYVYDLKEDRNYILGSGIDLGIQPLRVPDVAFDAYAAATGPKSLQWLATSRHLIYAGGEKIEVMEYDGGNRKTLYAGPFWDTFVVPWTNASKLVILTNLNPGASAENNLYAINLR